MQPTRPGKTHRVRVNRPRYEKLWRVVEGAVVDALKAHPEYITKRGRRSMVTSVTKRVVGALASDAADSSARRSPVAKGCNKTGDSSLRRRGGSL